MRKYTPIILSFLCLIVAGLLWDYIKLPYNENNLIVGEYYEKKFNPFNDILRFLAFVFLPCLIYLIAYLKLDTQTLSLNPNHKNYFLKIKQEYFNDTLKPYFFFFIILISLEFFLLDFNQYIKQGLDVFHDGTFLVPPVNYFATGEILQSTFLDYGLVGNSLGIIAKLFFGQLSIGGLVVIKLILIYLNKFFLILIAKKSITYLSLEKYLKQILFIIFTFLIISFPDYYDHYSYFQPRHSLYLLFIYILGKSFCDYQNINLNFFIVGTFSLSSILWWYDIGIFINLLIMLSIIILIIQKERKKIFFLISGVLISWLSFLFIMPNQDLFELLSQFNLAYSSSRDYLIGLEYLKPFSSNSGRWTKALILIYVTGLLLIHINFSKTLAIGYRAKFFITLTFISGVLVFRSALTRSDVYHLKYSSGLYSFIFLLIIFLLIFHKLNINKKVQELFTRLKRKLSILIFSLFLASTFLYLSGIFNGDDNDTIVEKKQNLFSAKAKLTNLIQTKNEYYLEKDYKMILKYYKKLSESDKCIQVMSNDIVMPYLLEKPSCSQFFIPLLIMQGLTENKFISQLQKSSPKYILFDSPTSFLLINHLNMPKAIKYINDNYSFFENINGFIFYKKKKN